MLEMTANGDATSHQGAPGGVLPVTLICRGRGGGRCIDMPDGKVQSSAESIPDTLNLRCGIFRFRPLVPPPPAPHILPPPSGRLHLTNHKHRRAETAAPTSPTIIERLVSFVFARLLCFLPLHGINTQQTESMMGRMEGGRLRVVCCLTHTTKTIFKRGKTVVFVCHHHSG